MKKTMMYRTGVALLGAACLFAVQAHHAIAAGKSNAVSNRKAKNIILMVPDGMGISDVTAARVFANGPNGDSLNFEKLPVIGYQRTHSANSLVTDSAAAAGAWATGDKYNNGEISCHSEDNTCLERPETILEMAQKKGKATGLVATSDITHATPAVFAAHAHSRNCEAEIGRQLVEVASVDVMLGGGIDANKSGIGCPDADASEVVSNAPGYGYTVVETKSAMNSAISGGVEKLLGIFKLKGKTPENFWINDTFEYPEEEPTLQEMTVAALDILEEDKDGFFLMVEGSQIDWANHGNRYSTEDIVLDPENPYSAPNTQLGEMLGFDAAVKSVMDWVNASNKRKNQTLVIVVADHETGGYHINGPYGSLSEVNDIVESAWTSGGHTAQDTIIWSQGPGSMELGKAIDNTDIFHVMHNYMK